MPSITELASGTTTIAVKFNRLVVQVDYYPGKITERVIQQIRSFAKITGDGLEAGFADLNALIVDLVASWDLTEADDMTMFPLDVTRLPELPLPFRAKLLSTIIGDMRPND